MKRKYFDKENLNVIITNRDGNEQRTRTVVVEGTLNDKVSAGDMFFLAVNYDDVPNGSSVYLHHITAEGKSLHSVADVNTTGQWRFQSFENAIITGGSIVTPVNRKCGSDKLPLTVFTKNPTVTEEGTERFNFTFGSGTSPARATSNQLSGGLESIFCSKKSILIKLTNESGASQNLSLILNLYED